MDQHLQMRTGRVFNSSNDLGEQEIIKKKIKSEKVIML